MNNAQRIKILNDSGRSAFASQDIYRLWQTEPLNAKAALGRMTKNQLLLKLGKGYYALNKEFNIYELANSIIAPSYVSCQSALFYHGISFQVSAEITSVCLIHYKKTIAGKNYVYHAMKKSLFYNLEGIDYKNNLAMAEPERALLDCLYFNLSPNLDNPDKINKYEAQKLAGFYPQSVEKKLKRLI